MATKAQNQRADQQRANQLSKPERASTRKDGAAHKTGLRGTAARTLKTAPSHLKGGPALEDSTTTKPTRKSTRGSSGHVKLATNLQRREVRRTHSPEARAARNVVR